MNSTGGMSVQDLIALVTKDPALFKQYALATVLGLVVLWVLSTLRQSSRALKLPGPTALPLFGNTLALYNRAKRNGQIWAWAEQYGGIFKLHLLRTPYVVITDPDLAHELLVTNATYLSKPRDFCNSIAQMLPGTGTCLFSAATCSDSCKAVRRCLSHSFSLQEVALDCEVARNKALQLVATLASLGPGVVVNMADATTRLSLDVLGVAMLGYNFGAVDMSEDVMLLRLLRECGAEWTARQVVPIRPWLWMFIDSIAESRHTFHMLKDFVRELWTTIKSQGQPVEDDLTLAAQLMRLRDPRTGKIVPDDVMVSELAGLLLCGHEALGHGLAWALYLLAEHPDHQQALHQELLDSGCVDEPETFTLEVLRALPCLDGVVRETLRLYPVWGEGPIRQVDAPVTLAQGRHVIPKGTRVWVHTYAMQRSTSQWVDAERFRPERWYKRGATDAAGGVGQADAAASGAGTRTRYDAFASCEDVSDAASFLSPPVATASEGKDTSDEGPGVAKECADKAFAPFGLGPRGCLGQAFAQAHLKTCLGMLVSYFRFELSGKDPDLYAGTVRLSLCPPEAGLPLTITMRYPEMCTG